MEVQNENFKQDLSKKDHPGAIFAMKLLFREPAALPEQEYMTAVMENHLGEVDCFWHDEKGAGFAVKKYVVHFQDADIPPQLMITACSSFHETEIDSFQRSQMWDCLEQRDRILAECSYQVMATDMLAAGLMPDERAELDMDFAEALVELYPSCEAVYFIHSGKLILADTIRSHQISKQDRFIKFAVNARLFNIQDTEDKIVDTVGMSTLFLPDLQYHFHDMDPNWVVNHAYCIASYLLKNQNPIQSGDSVDGILNGELNMEIQWKCQYENALIQPLREVIDIHMNQYASGQREA